MTFRYKTHANSYWIKNKLQFNSIVYINAKGFVLADSDLSYKIQDEYNLGNINDNDITDIIEPKIKKLCL